MERGYINSLPPELLDEVFDLLVQPPPSIGRLHDQPVYGITHSPTSEIKSISTVSKKWRQAALPRLIRHSRILVRMDAIQDSLPGQLEEYLAFVEKSKFQSQIESFTLEVEDPQQSRWGYLDLDPEPNEIGYPKPDDPINALSTQWRRLFEVLDPLRFTIVAPPPIVGLLAACYINIIHADEFHMPYHILSLNRSPSSRNNEGHAPVGADTSRLLELRPWTSLLLNEGSFMRMHSNNDTTATPPSILRGMLGLVWLQGELLLSTSQLPSTVTSLSYIAILPPWEHTVHLYSAARRVERLYLQFIPRHDLLADSLQRQSVDMMRIDGERRLVYTRLLENVVQGISPEITNNSTLKEIECGDTADDTWTESFEVLADFSRQFWQADPKRKNVLVRITK